MNYVTKLSARQIAVLLRVRNHVMTQGNEPYDLAGDHHTLVSLLQRGLVTVALTEQGKAELNKLEANYDKQLQRAGGGHAEN